jgi:LAO/AO transport system kinase
MLELRHAVRPPLDHDADHAATGQAPAPLERDQGWTPPIVKTVAATGDGIDALAEAMEAHYAHLSASGEKVVRETARARAGFVAILRERLLAGALLRLEAERGRLDDVAARIAARQTDPYELAEELSARLRG